MTYIFTSNATLPQVFSKHFASKNQLPGLSIIGTLVENGLKTLARLPFSNKQYYWRKFQSHSKFFDIIITIVIR